METVQQLNAALDRGEIDSITWAKKMAEKGYDISPRKVVEAFRANPNQSAADLINTIGNAVTLPTRSHMEQTGQAINSLRENFNKPGGPASAVSGAIDSAGQIASGFGAAFGPEGSPGRTPLAGIVGDVFRGAGKVYSKMSEGNGRTLYGDGKFPGNLDLPARTQSTPAKQEPEKMGMLQKVSTLRKTKGGATSRAELVKGIAKMQDEYTPLNQMVLGAVESNFVAKDKNQLNKMNSKELSMYKQQLEKNLSSTKNILKNSGNQEFMNGVFGQMSTNMVRKESTTTNSKKAGSSNSKKNIQKKVWNPETEEFEK